MKDEAQRWHSTSEIQRRAELQAEVLGVPYEQVLEHLEERQAGGTGEERAIREGVAL
jgi:hypothetical protein